MSIIFGNHPDSWGIWFPDNDKQMPWQRYLDEFQQAGYRWTELGPYGYLPTDLDRLKAELNKREIRITGSFIIHPFEDPTTWERLADDARKLGEVLASLDARYLVPIMDFYTDLFTGKRIKPAEPSDDQWKNMVDMLHRLAALVKSEFDLATTFHHHSDTYVETVEHVERLLADTDPSLVNLCLDTGHLAYKGGDPVEFMRRYHARVPYLHIKNVRGDLREKVLRENLSFAEAVSMGTFCEPSEGVVNFEDLRDVLREVGYEGFALVEQDLYPIKSFDDALPIAIRTRKYLEEIGFGRVE